MLVVAVLSSFFVTKSSSFFPPFTASLTAFRNSTKNCSLPVKTSLPPGVP